MYCLTQFLRVRNSGVTWLGGSGSGSLLRLQSACQPWLQSSEGVTLGWRVHFQEGSLACWLLAGRPSVPCQVELPVGLHEGLHAMTAGFSQREDAEASRLSLWSHTPSLVQCFSQVSTLHCGRGLTTGLCLSEGRATGGPAEGCLLRIRIPVISCHHRICTVCIFLFT